MIQARNYSTKIRLAAAVVLGGLSLSACATKAYVRDQVGLVNARVVAVEGKAQEALQHADAAGSAAQAAGAAAQAAGNAAQAAAADARAASQGVDQLTARVDGVEQLVKTKKTRD